MKCGRQRYGWAFLAVLLLAVVDRLHLLLRFGTRYVSNDDAIYWQAVMDLANGRFREPYFYGQDYTVMTEAFFAVPIHLVGIPLWVNLPAMTSLLALVPFWCFGWWWIRRGRPNAGLWVALLPLLLPVEHGIITSMPRGFIGGVAILALWPWTITAANPWSRGIFTGLVAGLALLLNPNALVFVLPAGLLFAWDHLRHPRIWIGAMVGLLPPIGLWWAAHAFYRAQPERVTHTIADWMLTFHGEGIIEGLGYLDGHFAGLMPVIWSQGWLLFILLIALTSVLIAQRSWAPAYTLLLVMGLVLWSFGFGKVHDGIDHVLFPLSRMFLALPLVLAWWGPWACPRDLPPRSPCLGVLAPLLVGLSFLMVKAIHTGEVVSDLLARQHMAPVQVREVADVRRGCAWIAQEAEQQRAAIIVLLGPPDPTMSQLLCYTCAHFVPSLPPTVGYGFDRRYWQRQLLDRPAERPVLVSGGTQEDISQEGGTSQRDGAGRPWYMLPPGQGSMRDRLEGPPK